MPEIDSLEKLIFGVAALVIFWGGKIFGKWIDEQTEQRRKKVDRQARAETRARLLTESLHEHRNMMIESGRWTRESLPPFIEIEKDKDNE